MSQLQGTPPVETDELLSTKLAPPRLRSPLVSREPLLAQLDEGLDHKLTLISAPAGFGKTILVSHWLHHFRLPILDFGLVSTETSEIPKGHDVHARQTGSLKSEIQNPRVAWVALDAGDNDPVRFWRYVLTACQVFAATIGASALVVSLPQHR